MQAMRLADPLRASMRGLCLRKPKPTIFRHVFGITVLNSEELSGPPNSVHQRGRLAAPESGPVFGNVIPILSTGRANRKGIASTP